MTDQTIVNQNGIADGQIFSEAFISNSNDFVVADDRFVGGEGEGLARFQGNVVTAFQFDGTDFRTFGVEQDCGVLAGLCS